MRRFDVPDEVFLAEPPASLGGELVSAKTPESPSWVELRVPQDDLLQVYKFLYGFSSAIISLASWFRCSSVTDLKRKFNNDTLANLTRAHWERKISPVFLHSAGVQAEADKAVVDAEIERLKEESLARFVRTHAKIRILKHSIVGWNYKNLAGIPIPTGDEYWAWEERISLWPRFAPWIIARVFDLQGDETDRNPLLREPTESNPHRKVVRKMAGQGVGDRDWPSGRIST